jgi:hydrogenase expression/formation protein HypE
MDDTSKHFDLGKLPAQHLARLLSKHKRTDPRVVLGPQVGEDAAVLDMGTRYLIAKSDPITFATDAIGWYAVHVNANDVACTGAAPRWFLATLLLPEGRSNAEMVDGIFEQIVQACDEIGATLVGGHTEITYGLGRPILIGAMLGEVEPKRLVTTGGARPGDLLLFTQRLAVEGTAIIAREKREALSGRRDFPDDFVQRCADFIFQPGISVVRAARVATTEGDVHAMHDPTEGGLATGLWELATAAQVGLEIDAAAVPIFPETRRLCDIYGLDPWGIIASGSLLLAVKEADALRIRNALEAADIETAVIGRVVERRKGVLLNNWQADWPVTSEERAENTSSRAIPLPRFDRDEIARLFE